MSDFTIGITLALLSSVTTASAHALLKVGKDKLAIRALIGLTGLTVMLPLCFFVPLPTGDMLPWLITGSLLTTLYQITLIHSYNTSDFAVAYPIARGIAPISTAILGMAFLGDRISPIGLLGVIMISVGIVTLAMGRSVTRAGLIAAGICGLLTTAYTVVDAHAIRLAPQAMTFIAWFFVLDGLMIMPIFLLSRRGRARMLLRAEGGHGLFAGLITLISFGSALFALRIAPVGVVSALRETSVICGVLIAAFTLKEHVSLSCVSGALVIALGAILIVAITV